MYCQGSTIPERRETNTKHTNTKRDKGPNPSRICTRSSRQSIAGRSPGSSSTAGQQLTGAQSSSKEQHTACACTRASARAPRMVYQQDHHQQAQQQPQQAQQQQAQQPADAAAAGTSNVPVRQECCVPGKDLWVLWRTNFEIDHHYSPIKVTTAAWRAQDAGCCTQRWRMRLRPARRSPARPATSGCAAMGLRRPPAFCG